MKRTPTQIAARKARQWRSHKQERCACGSLACLESHVTDTPQCWNCYTARRQAEEQRIMAAADERERAEMESRGDTGI